MAHSTVEERNTQSADDANHSSSDVDDDPQHESAGEGDAAGASSAQKKKGAGRRKRKSRASKIIDKLTGSGGNIPQSLVDKVTQKVKEEQGENAPGTDEESIRSVLEQLKVMDVIKGKSGLGGKGAKSMGEHKFWATQPVPQLGEAPPSDDGCIEPSVTPDKVRQDAYPLPKEFEWVTMDLTDSHQLREVYELLSLNYVEDEQAVFRFQYTAEFLRWALMPPGYHKEWHIGVRVVSNKKLVAFISGIPISVRVRKNFFDASEINFLCVHKKLRSKRLAPVLIKEVTRQCHLKGIFQALYTAGVVLPTPVSSCRYFHRTINIPKLVETKFTFVPRNMTIARMVRLAKLPSTPYFAEKGLREMEERDLGGVKDLYDRYMERFSLAPTMSVEEMRHQFLSGLGDQNAFPMKNGWKGKREGQVVWSFVIEHPQTKKITDFFTFYSLPSTVIQSTKYPLLEAAYLYYYATSTALEPGADEDGRLKKRLLDVMGDALVIAENAHFDVLNALTLMDNTHFLQELKFGTGDGMLNYYLYNWRTPPLAGVNAQDGVPPGRGIGVVML